jgi:lipoprotein-anchoring transpeptidase ErfK/SrfK
MSKKIEVNLSRQVLFAFDGAKQVFAFDCVSGDSSHPTPPGHWRVNSKHRYYTSHKYHVRMDYAMFFTTTGEAIHQSHVVGPLSYLKSMGLGFIGSHGCVRLAEENAAALFKWTPIGTPVWVH